MASDLISLEQSMHGKAVKPGFVDRDDLHRLADPSERFRREPAQKHEQRISVAARAKVRPTGAKSGLSRAETDSP
jgi:hypothetical protein